MTRRGPLRLALVVPNLAGGGGVQAVGRFIRGVARRSGRYDLMIVSLSESARDPASLRLSSPSSWLKQPGLTRGTWEGEPFVHVGAWAGEFEFQRYRPRQTLTDALVGADLIQVVCGFPAWANAVVGLGKPVAMHTATLARLERRERDAGARSMKDRWRRAMTLLTERADERALRAVDAIQVMNPGMLAYARARNEGRDVDIRYLPPGVNAEVFRPRNPTGSPHGDYVLSVARLTDPRKRLDVLLHAFSELPARMRSDVRLVLAGPEAPPESFWQQAARLGIRDRVTIVERPDQAALLRLYQDARVFVLPSDEEGFGMVVLEAMACGVPVISTRSGGPDGIITDAEDGYLVDRNNPAAIAARMAGLLADTTLRDTIGSRARLTVERRYDDRVAGEQFVDVWERLARKAGLAS